MGFNWFAGTLFAAVEILAFYFVIIHGRKQDRIPQLTKIGFVMAIIQIGTLVSFVQTPSLWGEQIGRIYDMNRLITPADPNVQLLKEKFEIWTGTAPNVTYAKYSSYNDNGLLKWEWYTYQYRNFEFLNWSTLDELEQAMVIDYYVRTFIVEWTSDDEVYGLGDYKASPHQILAQNIANGWTAPAKDDCDGIAVVTVSLMRNYGLSAYIAEGKSHWFTAVRLSNETMTAHGLDNPVFFDYWSSVHVWSYFDADEFYLGQNPVLTIMDMLFIEDEESFTEYFTLYANYKVWFNLAAIPAAIILVLFIGYPRHYPQPEEEELRKKRQEKIAAKWKWSQKKWNPLAWVLYLFYVRTGNPFRKVYRNEWLNIAITTILIMVPLNLIGGMQGHLNMYALVYLNAYMLFIVWLLHWDVFVAAKDKLMKKFRCTEVKSPILPPTNDFIAEK
jgi:hypothetical protein